jgi:transcriptional regulator with XRE-family HTH domain
MNARAAVSSAFDAALLGKHVLRKRMAKRQSQRATAAEIGVSASTLCRVETEYAPDIFSFGKICRWLGADPSIYLNLAPARKQGVIETERKRIADELAFVLAQFDALPQRDLQQMISNLEHRLARGEP